ncbi:hypothetical protein [uncultured Ruminococcus sp.]|uniref:hypothetical protein n=1 Tax=uncultured Ruminococcus sp. TaxID=165186 RepID=UPI0025D4EC87|nr:hypothetical protein [uncultured Ruminococcus sp.]
MANGDWDKMNRAGKAVKALIVLVGSLVVAGGGRKLKKEQQIAALKRQLEDVRYKLSKMRGNIVREVRYAQEIKKLERQEAEIQRQIRELGG